MSIEQMYDKIYFQNCIIDSLAKNFENYDLLKWDKFENQPIEEFENYLDKIFEDETKYYVVGGTWCFDELGLQRIYEVYNLCISKNINIILVPEMMIFVICKDKDHFVEAFSKIPKEILEVSTVNLKDVEFSNNGVTFIYNNHRSFKEFEKRPEYVYKIIEERRNAAID